VACTDRCQLPLPVGVLTAGERTEWARARAALLEVPANRAAFEARHTLVTCFYFRGLLFSVMLTGAFCGFLWQAVDRSLAVICLDDEQPADQDAAASLLLAGRAENRWHALILFCYRSVFWLLSVLVSSK
jgi:hypothetical protein